MSDYAGQDNGTLRVTIREAASRLGVTEAAVRKRIQRGSMEKEMGRDGRVYLYLDPSQDTSHPESQIHREPMVDELVEELRDRVAFLERSLERRSIEAERYQQIVVGLTQTNNHLSARVLELDAPAEAPGQHVPSEAGAQDAANGAGSSVPPAGGSEAQNGTQRPWWRRVFGG